MTHAQDTTQAQAALLRNDSGIAAPVTDCGCEAASIIDSLSATTEGLVPHEKLREAATPKASLIALDRPPAQLAKGYTHPTPTAGSRAGGPRYWPADLTNVQPEEWAQMSPKYVAEFAGTTEVWLLLEAAQQHIAELEVENYDLRSELGIAEEKLIERDALLDRLRNHLIAKDILDEFGPELFQILTIEVPERTALAKAVIQ